MAYTETLNLEQAVNRAIASNISLKKNAQDLSNAAFAQQNTWSQFFPLMSASLRAGYQSNVFTNNGLQPFAPPSSESSGALSYTLSATVNLQLTADIPSAIQAIKYAYQNQLLTFESARRQLELQVTVAFYGLIAQRDHIRSVENNLNLARRQEERTRTAFQNGLASQMDARQSELNVRQAELNLSSARSTYQASLRSLLALIGVNTHSPDINLEGAITVTKINVDPEQLIQRYIPSRPDIQQRIVAVEQQELTARRQTINSYAPSLSVGWGMAFNSGSQDKQPTDPFSISVGVTIPISSWIPGSKENQPIYSARVNVEKAKLDLQEAEQQAAAEIRSLAAELNTLWEQIELARLQVGIAQETYTLREQAFRVGAAEALILENARQAIADAEYQQLQYELNYLNATLRLASAINGDWHALVGNQ